MSHLTLEGDIFVIINYEQKKIKRIESIVIIFVFGYN